LQALIGSAILWSEVVPFCRPLLVPFSKPRATVGQESAGDSRYLLNMIPPIGGIVLLPEMFASLEG